MNTKLDLLERMQEEYASYSKGQKAIAKYISENYDKAAFMTAGAMGREVGVSESTVVRFAYALGYGGYPELQKHLQEIIKNKLTNVQRLNLMEGLSEEDIIDSVLKMETNNLKATRQMLDMEVLEDVIESIVQARKIFVIGFRSSAPLAQFLTYYLSFIFENPQQITLGAADIYSQLVHVDKEDVVIGLGFPRYSMQTVEGLEFAKERGAKIITLTDNKLSPLYAVADDCILTKSNINSFVDSLVAPLSIINALIIMIGLRKKNELLENFSVMEQVWREKKIYAMHDYDLPSYEGDQFV
ncbi:MAG: MurR/RpiR family transcriptional regulator [Christensenellaceae bacterium]|jgi:DNA-binding MurR/RpiR family transcriptional regulator